MSELIKENPLVSILIPTFNREDYISDTISSALAQTYQNIEIIVVDNASTDNTWEICKFFSDHDSRVKVYRNKRNIGPVKNWSRCISYASGQYAKILWSDDLIAPTFLSETIPMLVHSDVGFVYTATRIFSDDIDQGYNHARFGKSGLYDSREFISDVILNIGRCPYSPGCAVFRLSDLKNNLLINIDNKINSDFSSHAIGNDLLIYLLTANSYQKFGYVDKVLSFFRAHNGSISVSSEDGKLELHYALAKAFFVENYYQVKIEELNSCLLSFLRVFEISRKFGLNEISDFYMLNDNFKINHYVFFKMHVGLKIKKTKQKIAMFLK